MQVIDVVDYVEKTSQGILVVIFQQVLDFFGVVF